MTGIANREIYEDWAQLAKWKVEQAVCLILGLDPGILDETDEYKVMLYQALQRQKNYSGLLKFAILEIAKSHIKEIATPVEWIKWAKPRIQEATALVDLETAVNKFYAEGKLGRRGRPRISKDLLDKIREVAKEFYHSNEAKKWPATKLAQSPAIVDIIAPGKYQPTLSSPQYRNTYGISLRTIADVIRKVIAEIRSN